MGDAAGIFPNLADCGRDLGMFFVSFEKNFDFCKIFVCIWGKMGYNKV